jgi:phosphatidylglycerophosphate synthase
VKNMIREYGDRLKIIRNAQSCNEIYTKIFSRHFSYFVTALLSFTSITPNKLTILMFPIGIVAGVIMAYGTLEAMIIGGVFAIMLNLVDTVDGELARFLNKSSLGGDYLDRLAHYVTNMTVIIGFSYGLAEYFTNNGVLAAGIFAALILNFDDASRDLLITCGMQSLKLERKVQKKVTKIKAPNFVLLLGQLIGSNTALFHLVPILASIGLFLKSKQSDERTVMVLLMWYLLIFLSINFLKSIFRIIKIKSEFF